MLSPTDSQQLAKLTEDVSRLGLTVEEVLRLIRTVGQGGVVDIATHNNAELENVHYGEIARLRDLFPVPGRFRTAPAGSDLDSDAMWELGTALYCTATNSANRPEGRNGMVWVIGHQGTNGAYRVQFYVRNAITERGSHMWVRVRFYESATVRHTNAWLRLDNDEFADSIKKVPVVSRQIGATGTIGSRGWGAVSVTHTPPGVFVIDASLLIGGNSAHNFVVAANIAGSQGGSISTSTSNSNTMTVYTFDNSGNPADRAFTLTLHYAPGVV